MNKALLFFCTLFCLSAWSENAAQLDTVHISSHDLPIDLGSQVILTEQDYAYEDLASILDKQTGLQTHSTGGSGSYVNFWLRGSSAKSTSVYLDGIRINDPLNGGVNLSTLPLWALSQVDIYKSTAPSQLANLTGTGSLNLLTRSLSEHSELKASTGSFGNQNIASSFSRSNYLISAEWFKSDNDFPYIHNGQTRHNSQDDYETHRSNNDVERAFILIKTSHKFHDVKLSSTIIQRKYHAGISDNLNDAKTANLKQNSTLISMSAGYQNWNLSFSGDHADHNYDDRNDEIGLSADGQNLTLHKPEIKINHQLSIGDLSSSFTLQAEQKYINKINIRFDEGTESDFSVTTNQQSFSHNLNYKNNVTFNYSYLQQHRNKQSSNTFNAGFGYELFSSEIVDANFSISKKSRLPTISELYLNQGNQTGNQDLVEETFIDLNGKVKFLFHNKEWLIELYRRESDDTIIYSYDARGIGRANNGGQSITQGIESQFYWQLADTSLTWGFEFIDSENLSNQSGSHGKYLPSFFHVSNYLSLSHWIRDLRFQLEHSYKAGMFYDTSNLEKAPDQNTLNLAMDYHQANWSLGFKINNILDNYYSGYRTEPLPGRSYLITLNITH